MNAKSLVAIAMVFSISLAFCACRKLDSEKDFNIEDNMFVVDSLGVTHEVVSETNEDTGETQFFYTDDLGNVVEVERKDVGRTTQPAVQTTLGPNGETEAPSPSGSSSQEGTEELPEQLADFFEELTDPQKDSEYLEETTIKLTISDTPINTDRAKTVTPELDSNGVPIHSEQSDISQSIGKSNQYTMKAVIKTKSGNEETAVPATVVRSGNNIFMETKLPVDGNKYVTLRILSKDGKSILYIPTIRAYIEMPADATGEMLDAVDYASVNHDDEKYVQSQDVTVDGKTYRVDTYEVDKAVKKYYFLNDELKRVEVLQDNGDSLIVEYETLSNTVDTRVFIPPTGYFNLGNVKNSEELLDKIAA